MGAAESHSVKSKKSLTEGGCRQDRRRGKRIHGETAGCHMEVNPGMPQISSVYDIQRWKGYLQLDRGTWYCSYTVSENDRPCWCGDICCRKQINVRANQSAQLLWWEITEGIRRDLKTHVTFPPWRSWNPSSKIRSASYLNVTAPDRPPQMLSRKWRQGCVKRRGDLLRYLIKPDHVWLIIKLAFRWKWVFEAHHKLWILSNTVCHAMPIIGFSFCPAVTGE